MEGQLGVRDTRLTLTRRGREERRLGEESVGACRGSRDGHHCVDGLANEPTACGNPLTVGGMGERRLEGTWHHCQRAGGSSSWP